MKKFDLHIHTKSTISDVDFNFNLINLKNYIEKCNLDCIAITNHNCFDNEQYEKIVSCLDITVLPGIEINIEGGHLLLIGSNDELIDFTSKCKCIEELINNPKVSITVDKLKEVFVNLNKYLIIPHYDKNPCCSEKVLKALREYISAGEVNSVKKFLYCQKDELSLTPVYFSDLRIKENMMSFSTRQTYLDIDDITIESIKLCLRDKNKVQLSSEEGHKVFQVLENGLKISTGLTVILGERSSGKSHTLNEIYDTYNKEDNIKYIKQFSLLETDDEREKEKFNTLLTNKQSTVLDDYLKEFKEVVQDVTNIDINNNYKLIDKYISSLLKNANDVQREDCFSKTILFNEIEFSEISLESLKKLINSAMILADNLEYKELINSFINEEDINKLVIRLIEEYNKKYEENLKKRWINEIIKNVKNELKLRTAATVIEDIDFYKILLELEKIKKFEEIVKLVKKESVIQQKEISGFKVIATVSTFKGAGELKELSGKRCKFSDAFIEYNNSYKYLQKLKEITQIQTCDYYKYFAKIKFRILNRYNFDVSGGERSEFNLLNAINDATQYDMLLLDEPESSFDNLFLKNNVNKIIKDLSQNVPVIVVTHNNTVGASIKPDYIVFTQKEINDGNIQYELYSGYPSNKKLISLNGKEISNHNILLDCLEAGENAYKEREISYEMLKN